MKTTIIIAGATLVAGITLGLFISRERKHAAPPVSRLRLEEILSIKELHLVKHQYQDLFFLHRKNNPERSIRAVIQVPVTLVSYIDLKKVKFIHQHDTLAEIILPRAQFHPPSYDLSRMSVYQTRSFQWHTGHDLYPEVSRYLAATLAQRMDSIHRVAIHNKINEQAEAEGRQYVKELLRTLGRTNVAVRVDSP